MVFLSKVKVKCFQVFPPFRLHCGSFHMNENVNFTITVPGKSFNLTNCVSFSESHNEYDNLIRLMECARDERLIGFYFSNLLNILLNGNFPGNPFKYNP